MGCSMGTSPQVTSPGPATTQDSGSDNVIGSASAGASAGASASAAAPTNEAEAPRPALPLPSSASDLDPSLPVVGANEGDSEGREEGEAPGEKRRRKKKRRSEKSKSQVAETNFRATFDEECSKVRRQIDGRIEAALQEAVSLRRKFGANVSKKEQATLRKTLEENDAQSHPAWTMRDAFSTVLVDATISSLVEAFLAEACPKNMDIAFVRALAKESPDSILKHLKSQHCLENLAEKIHQEALKMSEAAAATGADLNDKYLVSSEKGFTMKFGTMADFSKGLERRIGSPNPNLLVSMIREHCVSCDSRRQWTTGNYGVTTSSFTEFLLVVGEVIKQCKDDTDGQFPLEWKVTASVLDAAQAPLPRKEKWPTQWPKETKNADNGRGRQPESQRFLEELLEKNIQLQEIEATELTLEEGIMIRLYTGPLFEKYNVVPRGGALDGCDNPFLEARFRALCCEKKGDKNAKDWVENRYPTSIHVLTSGVVKLSKLSEAATVYRGLGGNLLPQEFWKPDKFGCKGGVEFGFMSTTHDRNLATQYAGDGEVRMVLEIETGSVDRGADLRSLSQYPHESELLFPPLTCLQVLKTKSERGLLVIKTRANINLRSPTIDEVISKRYQILSTMAEANTIEADQLLRSPRWRTILAGADRGDSSWVSDDLLKIFRRVMDRKMADVLSSKATAYNEDSTFLEAVRALVQLQANCKLQSSSLLREVGLEARHERLQELAKQREAMEVKKQTVKFSFTTDSPGTGRLWLFDALGFEKALDGLYYPSVDREEYRDGICLDMCPLATRDVELPGMHWALLSINGDRNLQLQAQALQSQWKFDTEMTMELELCRTTSRTDFTMALRKGLKEGQDVGRVTRLLLSNHMREELDLNDAGLKDEQGARLMRALRLVGGHLTDIELLLLGGNDLRSETTAGLAEALRAGALPNLRQLRCYKSPMGEDMGAMADFLAAIAEQANNLEVLTLDETGLHDPGNLTRMITTASASTKASGGPAAAAMTTVPESLTLSFAKLFQRLEVLDLNPNQGLGPGMGNVLAAGFRAAADATAAKAAMAAARTRTLTARAAARRSSHDVSLQESFTQEIVEEAPNQMLPLKTLRLGNCPKLFLAVGRGAIRDFFAGVAQCHLLEDLDLYNTGLVAGSGAGEALAEALPKCPKLRKLLLYGNPQLFGSDPVGSAAFCGVLGSLGDLRELWLHNTGLASGAGLGDALAEALPRCPRLRALRVNDNNFDRVDQRIVRSAVEARNEAGGIQSVEVFLI